MHKQYSANYQISKLNNYNNWPVQIKHYSDFTTSISDFSCTSIIQYTPYQKTVCSQNTQNAKSTGWRKKESRIFACVIHPSSRNESVQKHIYNDQTSSNMCRNFRLKHFCISHDTNKTVSHVIKQFLQAVHPLRCRLYAGYTKTSQ